MTLNSVEPVPAGLCAKSAAERCWDVAVIGAGPAGAAAARELARAGRDVLLVDKRSFPRDKVCGACFSARCERALNALGLSNVFPQLQAVPLNCIRLQSGKRRLDVELTGSWAVSRNRFDASLVRAAIASGVAFLPNTTATVLQLSDTNFRLVRLRCEKETHEVTAKIVIAADGLGSPSTAKTNEFPSTVRAHSRIGLGATFDSINDEYPSGSIYMTAAPSGYVGAVRMEDGRVHFAAAVEPALVQQATSPHEAIGSLLGNPGWWSRVGTAEPAWFGTPRLTRTVARPVARRIFLIGDAAGYIEPFTGEGIAWALEGAVAVVPSALQAIQQWDNRVELEWLRKYQSLIRARQTFCRAFACLLHDPKLTRAALFGFQQFPRLANCIARKILTR